MSDTALSQDIKHKISELFHSLSVKNITLGANTCINNRRPVTDVFVLCVKEPSSEFTVSFKLQTICADAHEFFSTIEAVPDVRVVFRQAALDLNSEERAALPETHLVTDEMQRKFTVISGTPDECAEITQELIDAGLNLPLLEVVGEDEAMNLETVRLYGEAVIPQLKPAQA